MHDAEGVHKCVVWIYSLLSVCLLVYIHIRGRVSRKSIDKSIYNRTSIPTYIPTSKVTHLPNISTFPSRSSRIYLPEYTYLPTYLDVSSLHSKSFSLYLPSSLFPSYPPPFLPSKREFEFEKEFKKEFKRKRARQTSPESGCPQNKPKKKTRQHLLGSWIIFKKKR